MKTDIDRNLLLEILKTTNEMKELKKQILDNEGESATDQCC